MVFDKASQTSTSMTNFNSWQTKFLKQLQQNGKSPNTLRSYKADLNYLNKFLVGSTNTAKNLPHFTYEQIQEFSKKLHSDYPSENSRRRRLQTLRLFYDFLLNKNLVHSNFFSQLLSSPKKLDLPSPPSYKALSILWRGLLKQNTLSVGPFDKMVSIRNLIIVQAIYELGLKSSQFRGPIWKDILITPSEQRILIIPALEKHEPYTVPLSDSFRERFLKYRNLRKRYEHQLADEQKFPEIFFRANRYQMISGGLSSRGIESLFHAWSQEFNIQLNAKELRQACIFRWINQGAPISSIKERLGLAPSHSLAIYQTLSEQFKFYGDLDQIPPN